MRCPRCRSEQIEVTGRLHYHHTMYGNRSKRLTIARSSEVHCVGCGHAWRTNARAHDALPDAPERSRCCAGLSDLDLSGARQRFYSEFR